MTKSRNVASLATVRLAEVSGVVAVVLGGSLARGSGDHHSDLDLGIYYDPSHPPAIADLGRVAVGIDDRGKSAQVADFGEWGPWIIGGAWLDVDGVKVDWLFRDLDRVEMVIADCRAGRMTTDYQPGHPHGFHSYIYIGEVHHGRALHDPEGRISKLKVKTNPYPARLKSAIIKKFSWESRFALETASKAAARRDVPYVAGCLFRSAMCMVQVLYALNDAYFLNEKGSVATADQMLRRPAGFARTVASVLAELGRTVPELEESLAKIGRLVRETERLTEA